MGRDALSNDEKWFKRLEEDGLLMNCVSSLGWGFWPFNKDGTTTGYFDEHSLRKLADEIERRNKPFWDSYKQYCREHENYEPPEPIDITFEEPSSLFEDSKMFATIIHDDTVGFKETEYGPSFYTEEGAQEYCKDFNKKHLNSNWSARVGEPGSIKAWHGDKDISPECPSPK